MANPTTNYGFVLPTPTDLVTDLPADFDVALQGVDTRIKALNPSTTLGDTDFASAVANVNTRLAIGTAGQILTVAGGVPTWAAAAGGGKVLQVVSATTTTSTASSSATFADTTLTATITPTSATSRILVLASLTYRKDVADVGNRVDFKLLRGATDLMGTLFNLGFTNSALTVQAQMAINFLDSPATAAATTYKVQFANANATASVTVQINSNRSTIILMEIGA